MRMVRRIVLLPLILVLAAVQADSGSRSLSGRPNLVFILTDDQDLILGSLDFMPRTRELIARQGHDVHQRLRAAVALLPVALDDPDRPLSPQSQGL